MKLKIWGWDKKPRTMLRYIKPGDIFCFELKEETFALNLNRKVYGFGRIMTKMSLGHSAEIFDFFSTTPELKNDFELDCSRLMPPLILDSYSLFDRKIIGDWRIIGRQEDYLHSGDEDVYFLWGSKGLEKKTSLYGESSEATEEEVKKYPYKIAWDDLFITKMIPDDAIEKIRML
ncbi:Imm26 family immunity protein [Motilimonas sp. E26]|uniref:Imm26 family immunity protein n=1 Tax=Motilimonas sp. E26 TaxID=2865674 RepID=UPI001E4AE60A|nr:Imm26 family immunity protein [Motilimonas sp. E26]MCE0559024.1 immunity 26/phosphotriesterase HocA family protein [Motilimonas sp. E26]